MASFLAGHPGSFSRQPMADKHIICCSDTTVERKDGCPSKFLKSGSWEARRGKLPAAGSWRLNQAPGRFEVPAKFRVFPAVYWS